MYVYFFSLIFFSAAPMSNNGDDLNATKIVARDDITIGNTTDSYDVTVLWIHIDPNDSFQLSQLSKCLVWIVLKSWSS